MAQFASYLRRVLCKTSLIFPRINGPNVNMIFFSLLALIMTPSNIVPRVLFLPVLNQKREERRGFCTFFLAFEILSWLFRYKKHDLLKQGQVHSFMATLSTDLATFSRDKSRTYLPLPQIVYL